MNTTIYDIAKKANVSIATVSRALNPETKSKVAPDTAALIESLVKKHNYTPNFAAKNLSRTKFKALGIILPHHEGIFREDYFSNILNGVSDSMLETDYHLKTLMLKCDKKWDTYNFKLGEGVDGLIVTHWRAFFTNKIALENLGLPVVVVSDVEKNVRAHAVSGDHFQGGKLVAEYLYSKGHRKVAIMTGSPNSMDSMLRFNGFNSFWKSKTGKAVDSSLIGCGHFQEEKAGPVVEELFRKNKNITALFCLNDNMAFGAIKRLRGMGIHCPKDISVVGYDNEKRGESFDPPLTSVHVPLYEIAKESSKQLLNFLLEPKMKKDFYYQQTLLPVNLVERGSVRKTK